MKKEGDIVAKREVRAVLFDLDGTLVDSFDAWFKVYNESLAEFGFRPVTRNEFKAHFGSPIEKDVRENFRGCTVNQVENAYNRNFLKNINRVKLFPGAKETLNALKNKGYELGLITGSTRQITNNLIQKFNLGKFFNVILTMDDVKRRKPAPDVVLKACKILAAKPQNTILVGDTKNDTLAGKSAGCITIGYKISGDYKINHLKDVLKLVK